MEEQKMTEFIIKPKAVIKDKRELDNIRKVLKSKASELEALRQKLNSDSSTREIATQLGNIIANIECEEAYTRQMQSTLEQIVRTYQKTEQDIMDKSLINKIIDFCKNFIDGLLENNGSNNGGNLADYGDIYDLDPVNMSTGNYISDDVLFEIKGLIPISLKRYYNSMIMDVTALGRGWNHTYNINIEKVQDDLCINYGDGRKELFVLNDKGIFENKYGRLCTIKVYDDNYIYSAQDCYEYEFSIDGKLQKISDRFENCLVFEYEDKFLKSVTRSDNCKLSFEYNNDGYIVAINDHTGRKCEFAYDGTNMLSYRNSNDCTFKYGYAKTGMLESITDSKGVCLLYNIYDDSGRVVSQLFPDGIRMGIEYFENENKSAAIDNAGNRKVYEYDEKHRHIGSEYDNGISEKWTYNSNNRQTGYENNQGGYLAIEYDENGNAISQRDCYGNTANIIYNERNQPISVEYPNGAIIKNTYDNNGNLISHIDALGYETKKKYNKKGQLIEIIKPDGFTKWMKYDQRGNLIEISNSLGQNARFVFDDLNRIIENTDANGNSTFFEYNNRDNVTAIRNADGNIRRYEYNYSGQVVHCTDFDNSEVFYEYNSANKLIKYTDAKGNETKYEYDGLFNLVKETDCLNNSREFIYDNNNQLEKFIDEEKGTTTYEHDLPGNTICITEPSGKKINMEYDNLRRLNSIVYPDETTVNIMYDSMGRVISRKSTDGIEITAVRNLNGNIVQRTFDDGRAEFFEYTEIGKVKKHIQTDGKEIIYDYYQGGLLKSVTYPNGNKISYTYDGCGNIKGIRRNDGYYETREYDCMNRLKKLTDSRNHTIVFTYDAKGRMLLAVNQDGGKISYEYDLNGNRVKYTDEIGNSTRYEYDKKDNLVDIYKINSHNAVKMKYTRDSSGKIKTKEDALGNKVTFEYSLNGQLLKKTDRNGNIFSYRYDANNRLSEILFQDKDFLRYHYNERGNVSGIEDNSGMICFNRDMNGNIVSICTPDGLCTKYEYSKLNQMTSMVYPNGFKVDYEYDDVFRLSGVASDDISYNYEYNEAGKILKCSSFIADTLYDYNEAGELTSIVYERENQILGSYKYEYDQNGNVIRKRQYNSENNNIVNDYLYTYDPKGRLLCTYCNDKLVRSYVYDDSGNRIKSEQDGEKIFYKYNSIDQLVETRHGDDITKYTYDKNGNLILISENETKKTRYVYDSRNRMTEKIKSNGSHIEYMYDAMNNLTGIKEDGKYTKLWIDYTRSHDNIIGMSADDKVKEFIRANGLIGMRYDSESYAVLTDAIGSITKVIDTNFDIKEHHSYDEFGNDLCDSEEARVQNFGFAGVFLDDRLYHMKYRKYDTSIGRFLEEDPVESEENWYIYASDNPLKYVDPLGLESVKDINGTPDWMIDIVNGIYDLEIGDVTINDGVEFMLDGFTELTSSGKIDGVLAFFDFETNGDGVYHTNPDCWQRIGGYNDIYDYVFDAATSMNRNKNEIDVVDSDGTVTRYALWSWKGDYLNLGAGAETGLYKKNSWENKLKIDHYSVVGKDERVPMELVLYNGDEVLYDYKPGVDQWWITGFDSKIQNVDAKDLRVRGSMDLSGNEALYNALREKNKYKKLNYKDVCFNDEKKMFYYEW